MKVLIGCEESQEVTKAFRALGYEAYSCDLQECSGGHPEWHFREDVFEVIKKIQPDLGIFFPPCTYLSFAGNGYFDIQKYGQKAIDRWHNRINGMKFFYDLYSYPIDFVAVENPMGFPVSTFRKEDQTIEPYYFGDSDKKRTLLWLKNLPKLKYSLSNNLFSVNTSVPKPAPIYVDKVSGKARYKTDAISGTSKDAQKLRSKTFPGIARAMAEQWGAYVSEQLKKKSA